MNLHSTMLLLYLCSVARYGRTVRIYIPLCFYFIYPRRSRSRSSAYIYIPLCFYFIRTDPVRKFGHCNLHSTMLLLYPVTPHRSNTLSSIYIPLCFYFIPETSICFYKLECIYIPLCFYFIPFLFSPLISCTLNLYFVHLLFSSYFYSKNILFKYPKHKFSLIIQALSTYREFFTIPGRQS